MAVVMDTNDNIKSIFDKYATQYNDSRQKLIPCYDDFYKIAVEIIPFKRDKNIKVLDLGAGTGLISSLVASKFGKSAIKLIDVSENMLNQAKSCLGGKSNKYSYLAADYSTIELSEKFDIVISALSIHHLTGKKKKALFKNIYNHLNHNGVFINADQVQGETAESESKYREVWLKQVQEKGVSKKELAAALERMKEDKMSTLSSQLLWLKEAEFDEVTCWYQNYSFAVFSGRKILK